MKNLEEYINDNRQQLDVDVPSPMIWNNIEQNLQQQKKKKRGVYYMIAAAASVLLTVGYFLISLNSGSTSNSISINYDDENVSFPNGEKPRDHSLGVQNGKIGKVDNSIPLKMNDSLNGITTLVDSSAGSTIGLDSSKIIYLTDSVGFLVGTANLAMNGFTYTNATTGEGLGQLNSGTFSNQGLVSYEVGWGDVGQVFNSRQRAVSNGQSATYTWSQNSPGTGGYLAVVGEYQEDQNRERYNGINENEFIKSLSEPVSTFSIDVDAASYSNTRRFINDNQLPPPDAVRIEELINYFNYDLEEPKGVHPFSITTETGVCPWNKKNKLVQISLKGKSIDKTNMPTNNLVFLIDVSGSMTSANKLGLLKKGFRMLTNELRTQDKVAIVVYAGAAGVVLEPTAGNDKPKIMAALERLSAGGSTAGGAGIELAYKTAEKYFDKEGNNRVILATDGDFNVGVSGDDALVKLIEGKRKSGIFLSVMGFGTGNLQDSKMEQIADNGNGNYSYIDNILEAKKVLVTEMGSTLLAIAKDVKLQLEFNPAKVAEYRLIGYENRLLNKEDFADDTKDAGELGSGHTVTALYEIVPVGSGGLQGSQDGLKYKQVVVQSDTTYGDELLTVKFRYKPPSESKSKLIVKVVKDQMNVTPSANFNLASAVAEFGMLLRQSKFKGKSSYKAVMERVKKAKGADEHGYRTEFLQLVEKVKLKVENP